MTEAAFDRFVSEALARLTEVEQPEHSHRFVLAGAPIEIRCSCPELWARMAATSEAELAPVRAAFLDRLARHARAEFARALPAIPCASLMRPRAEARGRQALDYGLAKAMRDLKPEDAHVEA